MSEFNRRRVDPPQQMPASFRPQFFKTVAGPGETAYPEAGSGDDAPTVYYARMLAGVTFPNTPGAQYLTYTETDYYTHVFNLEASNYIEEHSVILGFPMGDRWYTIDKVKARSVVSVTLRSNVYTYDSSGNLLWSFDVSTLNEGHTSHALKCRWSEDRHLYVEFMHSSDGQHYAGIVKLDSAGDVVWTRELGEMNGGGTLYLSPGNACGRGIVFDAEGNLYVAHYILTSGEWLSKLDPEDGATLQAYTKDNTTPLSGGGELNLSMISALDIDQNGKLWCGISTVSHGPSEYVGLFRLSPSSGVVEYKNSLNESFDNVLRTTVPAVQAVRCVGDRIYFTSAAANAGSYPHTCPIGGEESFVWVCNGIDQSALTLVGWSDACQQMAAGEVVAGEIADRPLDALGLDVSGGTISVATRFSRITDSVAVDHYYCEHGFSNETINSGGVMAPLWSRESPVAGSTREFLRSTQVAFGAKPGELYFGREPQQAAAGAGYALARVTAGGGMVWQRLPRESGDNDPFFVVGLATGRA